MAQYMLEEDEDNKHEKPWGLFGSNLDSSVRPSEEPSPPLTPPNEKMKITDGFQSKQALIDDQIRAKVWGNSNNPLYSASTENKQPTSWFRYEGG